MFVSEICNRFKESPISTLICTFPLVSFLLLPNHFMIIFCLFVIGFLAFYVFTVMKKNKEAKSAEYERLSFDVNPYYNSMAVNESGSPFQQKNVSYCMIDGRMVD